MQPRALPGRAWAIALLSVGVLSACTRDGGGSNASFPPRRPTPMLAGAGDEARVPCAGVVGERSALPSGYRIIVSGVALPDGAILHANVNPTAGPDDRLFSKSPLYVRTGVSADLRLSSPYAHAAIGWGSPPFPSLHVGVRACVSRTDARRSAWLIYSGGYWVGKPTCLGILVSTASERKTARVGVEAACR